MGPVVGDDFDCYLSSTIKGFGAQRAKQVVHWLILEQDHLNLLVSASVHEPKSKQQLRVAALVPIAGQDSLAVRQFGAGTLNVAKSWSLFGWFW